MDEDWKNANINPINKKGNRNLVENYRPVSLACQICKLFESIILDALVHHLETTCICLINDCQHGFRKCRFCLHFLDFVKAFDKVPHRRLACTRKLLGHGINGTVDDSIVEWLRGRHKRVCLRGSFSRWLDVLSGVPQDLVLGPILFLININDLYDTIKSLILKSAVIFQIIRPHLEFCIAAWSPHYVKDKALIEKVQWRFTRKVPHLKHLPYEEKLARLKLWSLHLEDRRVRVDLIEVFKITHGFSSVSVGTFFEYDISNKTRGYTWKLKKKRV